MSLFASYIELWSQKATYIINIFGMYWNFVDYNMAILWFFSSDLDRRFNLCYQDSVFTFIRSVCVCAQLNLTLCNPMDYSLPSSSVCGIFQARKLEQLGISYFRVSSWPRDQTCVSCVSCIGKVDSLPLLYL